MSQSGTFDRAAALLILLFAAIVFAALVLWPGFRATEAAKSEAQRLVDLIELADRRSQGSSDLRTEAAQLTAALAEHPALMRDMDLALATARLQSDLRSRIEAAGGVPSQTRAGEIETTGSIARLPIQLQFTGDDEVLRAVIHTIDYTLPAIRVTDVEVRTLRTRDQGQYLAIWMTVSAHLLVEDDQP